MNSDEAEQYLKDHPDQFARLLAELLERQPGVLDSMQVPHPYGGRAIPLSERQTLGLREKVKLLEGKLAELIQFGEENDASGEKMHRLTLAMMATRDAESAIVALYLHLREDFAVPHVAMRLWPQGVRPQTLEFSAVSMASRDFAVSLSHPYCTARAMVDTGDWFGEHALHLRSFAYVALKRGETLGLLALASEDAQRFYPEMGTLHLQRLGEVAAASLLRSAE